MVRFRRVGLLHGAKGGFGEYQVCQQQAPSRSLGNPHYLQEQQHSRCRRRCLRPQPLLSYFRLGMGLTPGDSSNSQEEEEEVLRRLVGEVRVGIHLGFLGLGDRCLTEWVGSRRRNRLSRTSLEGC